MEVCRFLRMLSKAKGTSASFSRLLYFSKARGIIQDGLPVSSRCLSAMANTQTSSLRKVFRCPDDDPRNHSLDHVGTMYTIPESEMNGILSNCLVKEELKLMSTFNENCVMVRQPSLEVNGYLQNLNFNHPVPRFVYYGRDGAGKRFCLLHTIQFCAKNDWIVVHVPWANQWNDGHRYDVVESGYKQGRYDRPEYGSNWLAHFRQQNGTKLKDIKTTSDYIWTKREKAEAGTPLDDIIDYGLNRVKFSSDCIGVILKELRQQAAVKGFKVLVAINMVNSYFQPYERKFKLKNSQDKLILPTELSIVHNFKKMLSPTWTNGAVVCTVKERGYLMKPEEYEPQFLLGQEGFEWLDPFVPIHVPEYTEKEALNCLRYFVDRNWIQNDYGRKDDGMKEIMFVSNKNPKAMTEMCAAL